MSTFVLKKEYALELPTIYVNIDNEEIEYVDGGYYITNNKLKAAIVGAEVTGLINAATIKIIYFIKAGGFLS